MKNGRAKGAVAEREAAKMVAAWYGGNWRRTPLSGGWAKADDRGVKGFDTAGDLICDKPNRLHFEVKNREGWLLDDLLTGNVGRSGSALAWWEQASREATTQYEKPRRPILLFKRNHQPWMIMLRERFFAQLDANGGGLAQLLPHVRFIVEDTERFDKEGKVLRGSGRPYGAGPVVVMLASVFFARLRPPKLSPNYKKWQPKPLPR